MASIAFGIRTKLPRETQGPSSPASGCITSCMPCSVLTSTPYMCMNRDSCCIQACSRRGTFHRRTHCPAQRVWQLYLLPVCPSFWAESCFPQGGPNQRLSKTMILLPHGHFCPLQDPLTRNVCCWVPCWAARGFVRLVEQSQYLPAWSFFSFHRSKAPIIS